MKRCTKCLEDKPLDGFYVLGTGRRKSRCKDCQRSDALARYRAGGEAAKARANARIQAMRLANPEANRERARRWRIANQEKSRAMDRAKRVANPSVHLNSEARRRAAKRGATTEFVDRDKVWRDHDGMCGICRSPVPQNGFHLDHIVPLSKGGEHSYANVQPAHPTCNLSKGAWMSHAA